MDRDGKAYALMRRWSTAEIRYLGEHATEGADAVAAALDRSIGSVTQQAWRYGISLRQKWYCPNCCRWSYKPLHSMTGWCASCTKANARQRLACEVRELEEEVRREQEEDRKRQALYSKKSRLKKLITSK